MCFFVLASLCLKYVEVRLGTKENFWIYIFGINHHHKQVVSRKSCVEECCGTGNEKMLCPSQKKMLCPGNPTRINI
jgi:hypothetical protein